MMEAWRCWLPPSTSHPHPHALADGEALVELDRQINRLHAVRARATAAWDARQGWAPDGAKTAAAWLAARCRVPVEDAHRRVRLGRDLRVMPRVEATWLRGEINERHVVKLSFKGFCRRVAYWVQEHDQDGVEHDAEEQRAARKVHLSQSFEGMT